MNEVFMARTSQQSPEAEMQMEFERERREARKEMLNDFTRTILVGKKKAIMHPLDLSDGLEGFGDWLEKTGYQPSLAAIAAYLNVSKGIIAECRKDPKEYYYYEIQDHLGECIATQAIVYQDDLDNIKHGVGIPLLDHLTIDFLIDNYEKKHLTHFTEEEREKIRNCSGLFVGKFHKKLVSKGNIGHKKRLIGHELRLEAYNNPRKYKNIYTACVTGNVVIRKIKFADILQYFEQISELEWIENGRTARNPAMSIFMLMNNSGHTTCYQNKTITQTVITASEKEIQGYQERLETVIQEQLAEKSSK